MLYPILGKIISYVGDIYVTNKEPPKRLIASTIVEIANNY